MIILICISSIIYKSYEYKYINRTSRYKVYIPIHYIKRDHLTAQTYCTGVDQFVAGADQIGNRKRNFSAADGLPRRSFSTLAHRLLGKRRRCCHLWLQRL